jgi:PST family polysaccharide transporter
MINKRLIQNFSYLSILQVLTILAPLATYPFLIRVLGNVTFGKVIWAYSITQLAIIIINFGFNITGTKEIAESQNDNKKISDVALNIYIIKILIFLLGLIIIIILNNFVKIFIENSILVLISYLIVIGEVFVPIWYFQGLEKMRFITYINGGAKILSMLLIFGFINNTSDFLLVPLLQLITAILSSIVSLFWLYKVDNIGIGSFSKNSLIIRFKESLQFFASRLSSVIIDKSNIFIIQAFFGFADVTYYDTATKIMNLFKVPYDLLNQTLFPSIVKSKNMKTVKMVLKLITLIGLLTLLFFYYFSDYLFKFVYGGYSELGVKLLQTLIIIAPLTGMGYFLGNTSLVVFGYYTKFNKSIIYAMIFYIITMSLLIISDYITLINIAYISILTTIFWVSYRGYYVYKYKILKQ